MKTNGMFVPARPDGTRNDEAAMPARIRGVWAITATKQTKSTWYTLHHTGTGAYLYGASSYQGLEAVSVALDALPIDWPSLGSIAEFNALPVDVRQLAGRTMVDALQAYERDAHTAKMKRQLDTAKERNRYREGVPYDEAPGAKPVAIGSGTVVTVTYNGDAWYGDGYFMAIGEAPTRWSNARTQEVSENQFAQIVPRRVEDEPAVFETYREIDGTGCVDTACGVRFDYGRLKACMRTGGKGVTLHVNTVAPKTSPALVKNADGKVVGLIMPARQ